MVVLDTNIVIDHLRQLPSGRSALDRLNVHLPTEQLGLSTISVQELFEGQSTRQSSEAQLLLEIIAPMHALPYVFAIARLAGFIARDQKQPIDFADAAIAATAIIYKAKLYTLNVKDFKNIPNLELYSG